MESSKTYKYTGAIHIHTKASDGSGSIDKITKAAKKSGLSWIIITDHNVLGSKEGIINGVYIIQGEEISPPDNNHYLALGITDTIKPSRNAVETIENVRKSGGFGFLAHPDECDNRKNKYKSIKWECENAIPDGIEIWNWFSQFADNHDDSNIFRVVYSYIFRKNLITKPYRKTLNRWDKLNLETQKIVPAIGGLDAHALKIKKFLIPVTVFPYEFIFKTIVNQVLLTEALSENFETAKTQILNALKLGRNIIANLSVHKEIPEIFVTSEGGNKFLNIKTTRKAEIFIYKDGEFFSNSPHTQITEKGKYRIEIEIGEKGFAYSNPVIIE